MNITEQKKLVMTSASDNNNKFWEYTIFDDNTIQYKWGRIGTTAQVSPKESYVKSKTQSKLKEKLGKGYREIEIISSGPTGPTGSAPNTSVKHAAIRDIAGSNHTLKELVQRLAEANKHEIKIASGGQMDVDLSTGIISTPLGVVSKNNVDKARIILENDLIPKIQTASFSDMKYKDALSEYLMLIPQKVAHRNWHLSFIIGDEGIKRQSSLLDQLETSIDLVEQRIQNASKVVTPAGNIERAFDVTLNLIDEKSPEFAKIVQLYTGSKNSMHTSSHLKVKRVFAVKIPHVYDAYQNDGGKMTNQWELWHGSRIFNILSIMKRGFVLPKTLSSAKICGAMFASGCYFSDQSTKSLNYAQGYWDSGSKDNNCFMFLCDVAMGNYQVPKGPTSSLPAKGYDSYFAKGKESGVLNNEMIVFRTSQANIKYLVEFQ